MAVEIKVETVDISRLANMIAAAGPKAPAAIRRAVNHTGDKVRTQMIRTLTAQTGLKRKVIVKALRVQRAFAGATKEGIGGTGDYVISSKGGDIALKYFKPREAGKGVIAKPWNRATSYEGTFLKGGRRPRRVVLNMGGHVFRREGDSRLPITKQKSGVIIPQEMVTGATRDAFFGTIQAALPDRIGHELGRILGK